MRLIRTLFVAALAMGASLAMPTTAPLSSA